MRSDHVLAWTFLAREHPITIRQIMKTSDEDAACAYMAEEMYNLGIFEELDLIGWITEEYKFAIYVTCRRDSPACQVLEALLQTRKALPRCPGVCSLRAI
jgi:hypothetical protein